MKRTCVATVEMDIRQSEEFLSVLLDVGVRCTCIERDGNNVTYELRNTLFAVDDEY